MRAPSRWVALGGLLPYGLSAIFDPLTPARAILLGLLIEAGSGPSRTGSRARDYLLLHFPSWLLLHFLRLDASFLVGASFLAAGALGFALWADRPSWTGAVPVLVLGAPLLALMMDLAGKDRSSVRALDPWVAAASSSWESAHPTASIHTVSGLPFHLPPRLGPPPFSDPAGEDRARILLGLWGLAAAGAVLRPSWRRGALWILILLPVGGKWLQSHPPRTIWFQGKDSEQSEAMRGYSLVFSKDPLPGPESSGRILAHPEEGIWSWVRPSENPPSRGNPVAWVEKHPLRPDFQEGPPEALAMLMWWARGERGERGARWEFLSGGVLTRRILSTDGDAGLVAPGAGP